jgi:protein-S-isoprenylcysteine O-methyltransferase Ste14
MTPMAVPGQGRDRVGILVPPPAYALLGLGAAYLLDRWASPPWPVPTHLRLAAAGLALLAIAVALWALLALVRRGTPFDPYRPTTALVADGPYRWSRNPIYLAFPLGVLGIGLAAGWWWSLATAAAVFAALDALVVRREERYLKGKFGAEYESYRRRVRRWL